MVERLILLPGWGLDGVVLQALAETLGGAVQVHTPVLPRLASGALSDWLDELDVRLPTDCWLAGWSLGGMLATALAARRGEQCRGLISLASNACFVARPDWPSAMSPVTFEAFYQSCEQQPDATRKRFAMLCAQGAKDTRGLSRQLQAHPLAAEPAQLLAGLRLLAALDNRQALSTYTGPQLHLLAEQDALVPAAAADGLRGLLARGEVQVVQACSHALVVEQAHALAAAMLDFMHRAGHD
ncbi:Pimeloyl-(acyl-carrier protein) methyl ester esterase [Pseudomonas sp. 8Z]|uniref:alpha/beta fold hydrolase n=1 Tax=Pseudomonas sp. 8Z TaxID=2653166 RepID=UPI0012F17776|nr:alpha/beta fold hydrolase [Pseudomonas sp. 8Z]VXC98419.1 Pimeloyl-(acyl-carrier protein) methyl ester esterase [Pseudomonas sp. 8Z]